MQGSPSPGLLGLRLLEQPGSAGLEPPGCSSHPAPRLLCQQPGTHCLPHSLLPLVLPCCSASPCLVGCWTVPGAPAGSASVGHQPELVPRWDLATGPPSLGAGLVVFPGCREWPASTAGRQAFLFPSLWVRVPHTHTSCVLAWTRAQPPRTLRGAAGAPPSPDSVAVHPGTPKLPWCQAVPGEDDHGPAAGSGLEEAWHRGRGKVPQKCRRFFIWKCEIMG